jgi:cytochrome c-type biogenesis protein CcmH
MKLFAYNLFVLLIAASSFSAVAGEAANAAPTALLEKRVMSLANELRCLVCQNQTIADSSSGLAVDLKNQIREKLQAGESEKEIVDYMVTRYGDFVRYKPPFKTATLLLWLGPLLLLLGGFWMLLRRLRHQRVVPPSQISPADHARVQKLLEECNYK